MATTANGVAEHPLLDQLQTEVNRVLEQTARLLAASSHDNKAIPAAHAMKLKQILPGSTDRFHHALDQLEDELQLAKTVMRRDLAVLRQHATPPIAVDVGDKREVVFESESETTKAIDQTNTAGDQAVPEDVSMADAKPAQPLEGEKSADPDTAPNKDSEEVAEDNIASADQPAKDASTENAQPETKSADGPLQIDTEPKPNTTDNDQQAEDEDKPPDTGTFSNTNDLDSLFGGPTSAGAGDAPDFTMNDANNDDFDFGSFGNHADNTGADNDNIAALLPGLQDYANTQPSGDGEPDFDALFSTDMAGNDGDGGDGQGGHRDSTFVDFMDFADFGGGDFPAEGSGNGNNENQDFDFSFD